MGPALSQLGTAHRCPLKGFVPNKKCQSSGTRSGKGSRQCAQCTTSTLLHSTVEGGPETHSLWSFQGVIPCTCLGPDVAHHLMKMQVIKPQPLSDANMKIKVASILVGFSARLFVDLDQWTSHPSDPDRAQRQPEHVSRCPPPLPDFGDRGVWGLGDQFSPLHLHQILLHLRCQLPTANPHKKPRGAFPCCVWYEYTVLGCALKSASAAAIHPFASALPPPSKVKV